MSRFKRIESPITRCESSLLPLQNPYKTLTSFGTKHKVGRLFLNVDRSGVDLNFSSETMNNR